MNCSDWEQEIASEAASADLEAHLKECDRCREFAREIEQNRAALLSFEIHPAALHAVRRRVLHQIEAKKRRTTWWAWSAVATAACAAILFVSYVRSWKNPAPPKVAPIVAQAAPPANPAPRAHRPARHKFGPALAAHAVRPAQKTEPLVIKMLTNDPNVIIIWLVDPKGDSL